MDTQRRRLSNYSNSEILMHLNKLEKKIDLIKLKKAHKEKEPKKIKYKTQLPNPFILFCMMEMLADNQKEKRSKKERKSKLKNIPLSMLNKFARIPQKMRKNKSKENLNIFPDSKKPKQYKIQSFKKIIFSKPKNPKIINYSHLKPAISIKIPQFDSSNFKIETPKSKFGDYSNFKNLSKIKSCFSSSREIRKSIDTNKLKKFYLVMTVIKTAFFMQKEVEQTNREKRRISRKFYKINYDDIYAETIDLFAKNLKNELMQLTDLKKVSDIRETQTRMKIHTNLKIYIHTINKIFDIIESIFTNQNFEKRIYLFCFYMIEKGYCPKENYFSDFELTRLNFSKEGSNLNYDSQNSINLIMGGFFLVRILIFEIIFKKKFLDKEDRLLNYLVEKNFTILGSSLYIIFTHFIKEDIPKIHDVIPEEIYFLRRPWQDFVISDKNKEELRNSKIEIFKNDQILIGTMNNIELKDLLEGKQHDIMREKMINLLKVITGKYLSFREFLVRLEFVRKKKAKAKDILVIFDKFQGMINEEEKKIYSEKYHKYISASIDTTHLSVSSDFKELF